MFENIDVITGGKTHQPNPVIGIANIRIAITMNNRISLRSRKCGNKQMWPSLSQVVDVVAVVVGLVAVVVGLCLPCT